MKSEKVKSLTKGLFVSLLVMTAVSCTNTIVSSDSGGSNSSGSAAAKPEITEQPQDLTYEVGAVGKYLKVTAKSTDGGTLSYQWHKAGAIIHNATSDTYVLNLNVPGEYKFFVRVTNKSGDSTNYVDSNEITVTVKNVVELIDAAKPVFKTQPIGGECALDAEKTLTVEAEVSDGGSVSYQWYCDESPLHSATGSSYKVDTSLIGQHSYKVEATNTNSSATGNKTAKTFSNTVNIRVVDTSKTNAKEPSITTQPAGKSYNKGESATPLSVTATVSDGGVLSYQWYKDGKEIDGETNPSYTPKTDTAGEFTYYVKVTNTIPDSPLVGTKSATVVSENAVISVKELVNAAKPVITEDLKENTYKKGDTAEPLKVSASVPDGGTLSYQWYKDGAELSGEKNQTYTPKTDTVGTSKYKVKITNTLASATGNTIAETESLEVAVTVNDPEKTNAAVPVISAISPDAVYSKGEIATPLSVTATVSDSGVISYQWYKDGAELSGEKNQTYTPKTDNVGTSKYKVKITNTLDSATGNQKAEKFSEEIIVVVKTTEGTGGISGDFNPQP